MIMMIQHITLMLVQGGGLLIRPLKQSLDLVFQLSDPFDGDFFFSFKKVDLIGHIIILIEDVEVLEESSYLFFIGLNLSLQGLDEVVQKRYLIILPIHLFVLSIL